MANDLTSNPLRCDTAATVIAEADGVYVQNMQWLDDDSAAGGVIASGEDLIMTINGVLHEVNIQAVAASSTWASTQLKGGVAWEISFAKPVRIYTLVIGTIDGGTLFIWKV